MSFSTPCRTSPYSVYKRFSIPEQKAFSIYYKFPHILNTLIFAKMNFFVFCRNFGFNLEKLSNHYSQLKKHLKVDPETRSYDFLTKTHEKIPTIPNISKLCITLEKRMIRLIQVWKFSKKMFFLAIRLIWVWNFLSSFIQLFQAISIKSTKLLSKNDVIYFWLLDLYGYGNFQKNVVFFWLLDLYGYGNFQKRCCCFLAIRLIWV